MATSSFPLTRGVQQPDPDADLGAYPDPNAQRIATLQALIGQPQQPTLTPEQLAQRQYENDKAYKLGMLGLVASGGNEGMQQLGGTLLKNSLAQRTPTVTERGSYDPLSQQWTTSPQYQQEKQVAELNRVEDMDSRERVAWQSARQAAAERRVLQSQRAGDQMALRTALGMGGDADLSGMVDALGTYKLDPGAAFARMAPQVRANLITQVQAKYPDYDPTTLKAKAKAANDFTTGSLGNAMRSFAVAGNHLDQLGTLVDAMDNGNLPLFNKVANAWATQTGQPAPTNFEAAKDVVSKEVVKAIVAGGGGVAERQELAHLMDGARAPAQLKGVIANYRSLMAAQHDHLLQQRRAAGLPDSTMPDYAANLPAAAGGQTPGAVDPLGLRGQ